MGQEREAREQTFYFSVQELAKHNPQISIPNPTSYQDMVEHFVPGMYDSIKLVRVEFFEKDKKEVRWQIVDGHTKTKFAFDHGDQHGITQLEVYDATDDYLNSPRIADRPGEKKEALNIHEYLRAVVLPTKEHKEIASRRIAAHLINGFEAMVGRDIAKQFSATAVLNLLSDMRIPTYSDSLLTRMLSDDYQELVPNATPEQGKKLIDAIVHINSIVRESRLRPTEVHNEAFSLIAGQDVTIGGQEKALAELAGYLNLPTVVEKTKEAGDNLLAQKDAQLSLAQAAINAASEVLKEKVQKTKPDFTFISQTLTNSELNWEETIQVLNAKDKLKTRNEIISQKRMQNIASRILKLSKRKTLYEQEEVLIMRYAEPTVSSEGNFTGTAEAIMRAARTIRETEELLKHLQENSDELLEKGIQRSTLKEFTSQVLNSLDHIYNASYTQLRSREKALREVLVNIEKRFSQEINMQTAKQAVKMFLIPKFRAALSKAALPSIQRSAVLYLVNYQSETLSNPTELENLMAQMSQIDTELLVRVFETRTTLDYALQLQRSKQAGEQLVENKIQKDTPLTPELVEEQNREFSNMLEGLSTEIDYIELNVNNITEENQERAWKLVTRIVKIIHGHPDVKRIVFDYEKVLSKLTRLQEEKAQRGD